MTMVAVAVVGGAVIGAGASLYAGKKSADAARDASRTASQTELEMYYQSREDVAPWVESGAAANEQVANLLAAGPGDFEASPGYQYRKEETENAMMNMLSPGGTENRRAIMEMGRQAGGMASAEYGNFWNRYQDTIRNWQNQSIQGQNAASLQATNALATGRGVAQTQASGIAAAGNAQAAGIVGAGSAINQGVGNYLNLAVAKKLGVFS